MRANNAYWVYPNLYIHFIFEARKPPQLCTQFDQKVVIRQNLTEDHSVYSIISKKTIQKEKSLKNLRLSPCYPIEGIIKKTARRLFSLFVSFSQYALIDATGKIIEYARPVDTLPENEQLILEL